MRREPDADGGKTGDQPGDTVAAAEEVSGRTDMSRGIAHDACRLRFPEYGQGRATLMEPQRTRKSPVAVKPKGLMVAGTQYVQHLCRWWKRGAAAKPVTPTFLPSQASYPVFRRYSRNASDSRLRLTPLEGAVEDSMLDACAPPTSRVSTRKAPWRKPGGMFLHMLLQGSTRMSTRSPRSRAAC